jgi:Cu2+-exporting ATPase
MMSDSCYHCGLDLRPEPSFIAVIGDVEKGFCCLGCQCVCQAIHDAGLSSFYRKTPEAQRLTRPSTDFESDNVSFYDLAEVQADCVTQLNGLSYIDLLVESIHCAACVWLIEKSLNKIVGIESAEANLTTKRIKVVWQPQQLKLSTIFSQLLKVGYKAIPFDSDIAEQQEVKSHRSLLYRMAFAGFAMMNMLWVSVALYSGADQGEFKNWFYWISFIIATPTLLYSGYPFLKQAIKGLSQSQLTMDLPIAIGATVTYGYSSYILMSTNSQGHIYFDTVVNFLFVILLGRYIEAAARRKALLGTHHLMTLQPKLANLFNDGQSRSTSIKRVKIGDQVLVMPGDRVPVDGKIIEGESAVDESMLTGESIPIIKAAGDSVIAGSINAEGALTVEVEQVSTQTALAKMMVLMTQAQQNKAPIQALADKIVPWFVLITLSLAVITYLLWYQTDFEKALLAATSVLIITCPCALGLATPMSIAVATGVAAKAGIILKKGSALEQLSKVDSVMFDKTGTLTQGKLVMMDIWVSGTMNEERLLQITASIESYSEHPVAKAVVAAARGKKLPLEFVSNIKVYPGRGISADIKQRHYLIGTAVYLQEQAIELGQKWLEISQKCEQQAISTIFIVEDNEVSGMMGFRDKLRLDAELTIDSLQKDGLDLIVLSGDRQGVVETIAETLGLLKYQAELLPAQKVKAINDRQQQGATVAMVGDGINDAAALIQADVGIALASGTGIAVEGADIVLSQNKLAALLTAKQLADKTIRVIKQNMAVSLTYNIIMVPLAMMALINPLVAAITMPISSLLVIANASRIQACLKD